jgi:hypothetical protein
MELLELTVLDAIVSEEALENGVWIHLDSPNADINGEIHPLFRDKEKTQPVRAKVRSYRSKAFRSKEFKLQTTAVSAVQRSKHRDRDAVMQAHMELDRPRKFAVLLVALENCTSATGPVFVSEEQGEALAQRASYQWLVEQVMNAGFDDSLFGGEPASGNAVGAAVKPEPPVAPDA